jgi:hypothetical protein
VNLGTKGHHGTSRPPKLLCLLFVLDYYCTEMLA